MADTKEKIQSVQSFGRKKTATAVAYCKRGKGLIKVGLHFLVFLKKEIGNKWNSTQCGGEVCSTLFTE